ncbi:uncharacterized protein LOC124478066 isoform X1 [Scomber scombrus]|uniref:Uncharacterized protein LOC124478066 isoform X1 n=1 Tax=Scomber scombrus TaxID=13677 RepID=A0AAV1PHW1_SCOSC
MWEKESEKRENKQLAKTIVKCNVEGEDVSGKKKKKPKTSVYPSFTGHGCALLGSPPPARAAPPPPYPIGAAGAEVPSDEGEGPSAAYSLPPDSNLNPDGEAKTEGAQGEDEERESSLQVALPPSPRTLRSGTTLNPRQKIQEVPQMPMVQVMGTDGPALVFRPWTDEDMKQAMSHLPDHRLSGTLFAQELMNFCKEFYPTMSELRRLLTMKMGSTDFAMIKEKTMGEERVVNPNWDDAGNAAYRFKIVELSDVIKIKFPTRGLHPDLRRVTVKNCVGIFDGARLTEVLRHAKHTEKCLAETAEKTEKKNKDTQQRAQLTMLQAFTQLQPHGQQRHHSNGNHGRGRGRGGKGRGGNRPWIGRDQCYLCRQTGHWAKECPNKDNSASASRGQSD